LNQYSEISNKASRQKLVYVVSFLFEQKYNVFEMKRDRLFPTMIDGIVFRKKMSASDFAAFDCSKYCFLLLSWFQHLAPLVPNPNQVRGFALKPIRIRPNFDSDRFGFYLTSCLIDSNSFEFGSYGTRIRPDSSFQSVARYNKTMM
jgi:hypothetical protein